MLSKSSTEEMEFRSEKSDEDEDDAGGDMMDLKI